MGGRNSVLILQNDNPADKMAAARSAIREIARISGF
jgi:hypothetical protein